MLSTLGTSDITDYFLHEIGSDPYADPDSYLSRSPVAAAVNVSTPTLIIHWDGDLRCPVSQAEEWLTALKLNGVQVRFVRYPGGSHTCFTPSQLVDRVERLIDWFSDPCRACPEAQQDRHRSGSGSSGSPSWPPGWRASGARWSGE